MRQRCRNSFPFHSDPSDATGMTKDATNRTKVARRLQFIFPSSLSVDSYFPCVIEKPTQNAILWARTPSRNHLGWTGFQSVKQS
jgi:hypothetical protein